MIREIGSEFWNVPLSDNKNGTFPKSTQWFISGRSALKSIIKDLELECHTIGVPSWCCDSMIRPFVDSGMDIHFYSVFWNDDLIQEVCFDCDVLFIMDYFGYTQCQTDLSDYSGIIIRDVTHSIFSKVYEDADYYFGSLRKWCGLWTGGYAWSKDGHKLVSGEYNDFGYTMLRKRAMQLKNSYINIMNTNERIVTNKEYLKIYEAAEECLENVEVVPASKRDILLAHRLDVEKMKNRRQINAKILREAFFDWLIFPEMKHTDCPMFVPVLIPDGLRDKLRKYLIDNEIFCPVHWPVSKYHRLNERELFLYHNELSLVCDQRYVEEDMFRLVATIKEFMKSIGYSFMEM